MEEQRLDMRVHDEKNEKMFAESRRSAQVCFRLNHTNPDAPEYRQLLDELFDGLDETSYAAPPINVNRGKNVKIGKNVFINNNLTCMSLGEVTIEDNVMIAPNVTILTNNHDLEDHQVLTYKPIHIRENAWIGAGAFILPGVTIGKNAVVGAASVVTKDIPDNCVAVGSPAKIIRKIHK